MNDVTPSLATALVGVAAFNIWKAYESNAPTLSECRNAAPGDITIRQRLLDADLTVGTLAVIIGVSYAIMTKDFNVMILMLVIFGTLSLWRRSIIAAEPR